MRRGIPVVLTGGAVISRGLAWTASSVIARLQGTEQAALVAPPAAARRFSFYNKRNNAGGYDVDAFFRPEDTAAGPAISACMLAVDVDEEFERARHGCGGERQVAAGEFPEALRECPVSSVR